MDESIPGLAGSVLHRTAAELHQRHRDAAGACACCGWQAPCPVGQHAAVVLAAVGQPAVTEAPGWVGWSITGRARPCPPQGFVYDRS